MTEQELFTLHQAARREGLRLAYGRTWDTSTARDPRRLLAESAERECLIRLVLEGHEVEPTAAYGARFDLLVDDCLRVEVKASTWRPAAGGRYRYAANFHNKADVVCWLLANTGQWFVVPVGALSPKGCIAVWSYDARDYGGRWARYLGAWGLIDDLAQRARAEGRTIAHQGRLC